MLKTLKMLKNYLFPSWLAFVNFFFVLPLFLKLVSLLDFFGETGSYFLRNLNISMAKAVCKYSKIKSGV